MLNLVQKAKALKELMSLTQTLETGQLKLVEKAKTLKRVMELVVLLGGESVKQNEPPKENKSIEDKNIFLRQIANDEINVFVDQSKLATLESIDENSVDMEVYSQAAVNAAKQVLTGLGHQVVV